jgi:hypothetical protein
MQPRCSENFTDMAKLRSGADRRSKHTVSAVFGPEDFLETLRSVDGAETTFIHFERGESSTCQFIDHGGERLIPYSPSNNLFAHDVILLPDQVSPYATEADLFAAVQGFIHRYVDLTLPFERVAATYVLLTWVYDAFDVAPYLRVRGDFGSGKTRFLTTVGSICYKPMFASGASTVSPLFRIIDTFLGTLVIDEGDFHFEDQAQVTKILNNGHARGFPVLRTEIVARREFEPRAYLVYGPKIVATRRDFSDPALESRCLTEDMGTNQLRADIPIILGDSFKSEAAMLRNQLLSYRFRNFSRFIGSRDLPDSPVDPRLQQILSPLFSVAVTDQVRDDLNLYAREAQEAHIARRGLDSEAQLLEVIHGLLESGDRSQLSLATIAEQLIEKHGAEYDYRVTARWVGHMLRKKLQLFPRKSQGVYVLPVEELPKLARLYEKFGIHDVPTAAEKTQAAEGSLLGRQEVPEVPEVPER